VRTFTVTVDLDAGSTDLTDQQIADDIATVVMFGATTDAFSDYRYIKVVAESDPMITAEIDD
jgi:hypothetical protein